MAGRAATPGGVEGGEGICQPPVPALPSTAEHSNTAQHRVKVALAAAMTHVNAVSTSFSPSASALQCLEGVVVGLDSLLFLAAASVPYRSPLINAVTTSLP